MVLLDGQPDEAFERLPTYPAFYDRFRRVFAVLPSLARLGVGRLFFPANVGSLPANARSLRDEFAELPTSLAQARSFQNLGDRPLVVVTAAIGAQAGWLPLQDEMATLSTNSSHRVVPYAHDALITDQTAAQTSTQAIRDVVHAVVRFSIEEILGAQGVSMPYVIGIVLSVGVALFARYVGFDRDRAFFPTVLIVIASYYVLFAASESVHTVLVESVVMTVFVLAAVVGFKSSAWIIVAALAGHGIFDALHGNVVENPGVPVWWPAFCLAYDLGAAGSLAWLIQRRPRGLLA